MSGNQRVAWAHNRNGPDNKPKTDENKQIQAQIQMQMKMNERAREWVSEMERKRKAAAQNVHENFNPSEIGNLRHLNLKQTVDGAKWAIAARQQLFELNKSGLCTPQGNEVADSSTTQNRTHTQALYADTQWYQKISSNLSEMKSK